MISVNNLKVKINNNIILEDVSFVVPKHKIVALIGNNGSGKTTTIKSILGLCKYDSGTITLNNKNVNDVMSRNGVAYVPENIQPLNQKCINFCRQQAELYGLEKGLIDDVIHKLCNQFLFPKEKLNFKIKNLSSGLKKIIMIICCFLTKPKIIIMDEPTEFLDPRTRAALWNHIEIMAKKGTAFLISTHNLDEIQRYADNVVLLNSGKSIYNGAWDKRNGLRQHYNDLIFASIKNEKD